MFRAFLGCSRAEFLFFRGKSENIMISRKKGKNFDMFGIIFCYLHLRIGNLLQKLWKYHSFQGVKSLYSGNVGKFGKFGWGRIFTCQGIFGLFLQNIYPWRLVFFQSRRYFACFFKKKPTKFYFEILKKGLNFVH